MNPECEKNHRICAKCDFFRKSTTYNSYYYDECTRKKKIVCNLVTGEKEEVGITLYAWEERGMDCLAQILTGGCGKGGAHYHEKIQPKSI